MDVENALTALAIFLGGIGAIVGSVMLTLYVRRRRAEMMVLTTGRFIELSKVLLDVQRRSLEAFSKSKWKGAQRRAELSGRHLVSYHLKALPNGTEHQLVVSLELHRGVTAENKFDLLRMLTYMVRLAQLPEVYPFDVDLDGQRLAVTRVLTVDQTQQLKGSLTHLPSFEQAQAMVLATDVEAQNLRSNLPQAK